jgi:hypothetical protein
VGIRDILQNVGATKTQPGTWRYAEKFGRFEGVGEVDGKVDLPRGKITLGSEAFEEVDDLAVELVGPDRNPVAVDRGDGNFSDMDRGAHNLFQIGHAVIQQPGAHALRVRAPDRHQPLLITVGEEFRVGDAFKQMIPGRSLYRRLRREDQ